MIIPRTHNGITIVEKTPERGALVDVEPQDGVQIAESETTTLGSYPHVTASRIARFDASKVLQSVEDLTSWIEGTTNQVIVTDDGDGTLTLSTPQDIHTAASPTFLGLNFDAVASLPSTITVGKVIRLTTDDRLYYGKG